MSTTDQTSTVEQSAPPEAPAGNATNATGPDRSTGNYIIVALETPNHRYWVHQYHLSGSVPDQLAALKEWYQRAIGKRHAFAAFMLCKKPYISIDRLEPPDASWQSGAESQSPYETQFEHLRRHETLSRGFARPDSLRNSPDIFDRAIRPCRSTMSIFERHALVVCLEIDRTKVALAMLLVGTLAVALSIGFAFWTHNVRLAITLGGGLFAVAALLQAILVWKYK
ncbi:hypothetical protein Q7P37_008116 [Cladosporium fusiforme]